MITYSGWEDSSGAVEVGALVPGLVESDGACTLTLTSGSASSSVTAKAEPDAASTSCPLLSVKRSKLAPGTWSAIVTYKSSASSGTSDAVQVTVP
jgi:hypothetical protein